ncbi:MAG: gliding motility protein GldL [Bacteroidetes bacterium]|jgi:gliding motility-associated protein GldL|nr:gliding motility protein GldL [Bacteroidota bacterium]
MSNKSFFETKKFKTTMNFVYGMGAAVVIVGALFKILHLKGADIMLSVGLLTEAGIFVISSFEPVHMDPDWSLVYPELAGGDPTDNKKKSSGGSVSQQLDSMLSQAKIGPELIESLGNGLTSLSNNVKDMGTLSNAAVATTEYAESASKAAKNMNSIADSTAMVSDSMGNFSAGLQGALTNINSTEAAAAEFAGELSKLNRNLSNLNSIYGNMLSAMGASKA